MLISVLGLMLLAHGTSVSDGLRQDAAEMSRLQKEANRVTIVRDDWGIAHIRGKTDADAVFGAIYAQAEDDFNRVETNYLNSMGRLAEAEGEGRIWQDLRMKLFIDPIELQRQYVQSPIWLQKLMTAWADGLNFFLACHPQVKPRVINHFEPWMALSFTEGSIGGDIERVQLGALERFYGAPRTNVLASFDTKYEDTEPEDFRQIEGEPSGSNGIAIGPTNTADHHSLLLINPHTSFFFRSELQMTSGEGLNAYGASTWGQFFIYQGFNEHTGWMHTSSGVDAVDQYLETIQEKNGHFTYTYGKEERPVIEKQITVPYKTKTGLDQKTVTAYFTSHGPVIREQNGKWISIQLMNTPMKALEQSYLRTKTKTFKQFRQLMELKANSSNNTIFADSDGDIAYFHGNFIPRRDARFDFTKLVDGSDPATDWHGLLAVSEIPQLLNPSSGFLFNVNNAPWAGAGESSLKKENYPAYVEKGGESSRGLHAIRVLNGRRDFSLDSLVGTAFDTYLPWFEQTVPAVVKAWDALPTTSPFKTKLADQIAVLRSWDNRWGTDSVATSLAVFWATQLTRILSQEARASNLRVEEYAAAKASGTQLLNGLSSASDTLAGNFGTWKTPWGEINRFQRLTGDIVQPFDDAGASIPVGFPSAEWGSLASFGARPYPETKKWYGTSGNSFVAAVEFGPKVKAKAVTAGGESGHPGSPHFDDEAMRYSTGKLRDVYFYPEQLRGHTERTYHPGQ